MTESEKMMLLAENVQFLWACHPHYRPHVRSEQLRFEGESSVPVWASWAGWDEDASPIRAWPNLCVGHMLSYFGESCGIVLNIGMIGRRWYCATTRERGNIVSAEADTVLEVLVEFAWEWENSEKAGGGE